MNKKRLLRCPPNAEASSSRNPFATIPSYQWTQSTFKSFSDEEIRDQAGQESLSEVTQKVSGVRQEEGGSDVDCKIEQSFAEHQVSFKVCLYQRWEESG
jgi:hypothetical protein